MSKLQHGTYRLDPLTEGTEGVGACPIDGCQLTDIDYDMLDLTGCQLVELAPKCDCRFRIQGTT